MIFFLIFAFIAHATIIKTHSFYKNLTPSMAVLYNQIKLVERCAIEKYKKEFPNVPDHEWESIDEIQDYVLLHLQNGDLPYFLEEPLLTTNPSDEEILEYCKKYIHYELTNQGLDPKKVSIIIDNDTDAFFYTRGPIAKRKPNHKKNILEIIYEQLLLFKFFRELFDNATVKSPPMFKEQSTLIAINMQSATNFLDPFIFKKASKHEIAHITSAHFMRRARINNLIYSYYSASTLQEPRFSSCQEHLQRSHELMADLLPAMLSYEYAYDLCNYAKTYENSDRKSDIHPSYKDLVYWLKRIILLHKIGSES